MPINTTLNQSQPTVSHLESMNGNFHHQLAGVQQFYGNALNQDAKTIKSCTSDYVVDNPTDVSCLSGFENRGAMTLDSANGSKLMNAHQAQSLSG
jgi:hypothetical protein